MSAPEVWALPNGDVVIRNTSDEPVREVIWIDEHFEPPADAVRLTPQDPRA